MEIKQSYLMWVGSEHYKTIEEWTSEAITQGISKRLPNADVAQALLNEGTAIFVAHDEGSFHECPDCLGEVECPDCRKRGQEVERLESEIEELKEKVECFGPIEKLEIEGDKKEVKRLQRLIDNRKNLILKLQGESVSCSVCGGTKKATLGTGGSVQIVEEGLTTKRWDYRRYNYWLHQPQKFKADDVISKEMCETCGGTGRLPDAKIFGLFIPDAVEYILKESDTDVVKEAMEKERGFRTVNQKVVEFEAKRKCGKRKPGGVYVVTSVTEEASKSAKEVVEKLVKDGVVSPEGVEVNGSFIRFLEPISVDVKRFRGIKKWSLDPRAEDEAEMILDALEQ